jgi:hypothetical protein
MSVNYIAVEFFPFHFRNRRSAVSEVKPPSGSRIGFKNLLELLETSRCNSFFKAEAMGVVIETCVK